jgi:dynein heavy chain 1, cytosolic
LPADELCIENAIMLARYNRYPLIVDPSGQAIEFIANEYGNGQRKLIKTSFLDDAFRKHLEQALRFGSTMLVEDVEFYDPILNPVLNHEYKKVNGRVLISVGAQEIDYSPSFGLFMCTRDSCAEFDTSLTSRVTLVNFTITKASLESQCLNEVLKAERPDVDQMRIDLIKLQGEFQQKLRHLEKDLLNALSEAKCKILEDDT